MQVKFVIDENISPEVAIIFREHGLQAHHINEMKSHQNQRIIDDQLRRLSLQKGYVVVTKDDDFVKSFVSRKVPEKLIFIYGLNKKEPLLLRMKEVAPYLSDLISIHDFIEINGKQIKFPFSD